MPDRYRDGGYANDNPDWHLSDSPHKAEAVLQVARRAGLRPRSVIDVGCGAGGVATRLAEAWPESEVQGWDIAPEAIARARAGGGGASFHVGDPCREGVRAELVLCLDVAEHVVDDVGLLRDLAALGPTLIVRSPLDLSVLDVIRPARALEARERYGHVHAYTRALARARLEDAGWRIEASIFHRVPPRRQTLRERVVDRVRRTAFQLAPETTVDLLGGWSLVMLARR